MTLELRDLGLRAGPLASRWLCRRLTHAVRAGAVTCVVGRNGTGKSTLLRTLLALRRPEEGAVLFEGRPILEVPPRRRAKALAYLAAFVEVPLEIDVETLVGLGRAPYLTAWGRATKADRRAVEAAMEAVGVASLRERTLGTLSQGELQRARLAQMLATEAQTLVLDEPTTALDIGHALALGELLRRWAREGRSIVVALHELELARRVGDEAVCLVGDDAGTAWTGPVAEVMIPSTLKRAFEVEVALGAQGLTFDLPRGDVGP